MAGGKQPGVMLYFTLRPGLKALSLEEKGMLLDAIFSYGEDGIDRLLIALLWPLHGGLFNLFWTQINRDIKIAAKMPKRR